MKQQKKEAIDLKDVNQFAYKNIMREVLPEPILCRHSDQSHVKVFVNMIGGYRGLLIVPDEVQKPSGADRRLLFQQRSKPSAPAQQWTQIHKAREAGWKFHLSISQDVDNLEKAWNILVPILLKYKVGETKIVHEKNQQEASKAITVYTFSGGPKLDQWCPFIKEVESAFRENSIRPGEKIYEYEITGSNYFYYRNDADHRGEYVRDEYNFQFRVVDQIPISLKDELDFHRELTENKDIVGCIVKVKGHESCCLYVKNGDKLDKQEFSSNLLVNLENLDHDHRITIAPILNRPAYLQLVVSRLDHTIPSTNNVTKEALPFKDIDLNRELAHVLNRDAGESHN